MVAPSGWKAIAAVRVAREAGRLKVAMRALDHACGELGGGGDARGELGREALALGRALAEEGASLAALSQLLRARALGADASRDVARVLAAYSRWRPQPGSIGVARDGLRAGASGAFWIDLRRRARVLVLEGGITGDGTEPFSRALRRSADAVDWVFVDMEKLSYVGSAGLALVVKVAEALKAERGGGLSIFAMSSNLKLLVETLGLSGFLNPAPGLAEAIDQAD